jgi:predicted RNA binding protein YcfA (HicA-like mRNA interferase family)
VSKLPRDVNADDLVKALCRIGYAVVRQTGSHIRLKGGTDGKWPITVPNHNPIRVGTLNAILDDVEDHTGRSREALLEALDL